MELDGSEKFDVVLADPPWLYEVWSVETSNKRGAGEAHYPTMAVEQIAALPVSGIAGKDAVLFLWVPWWKLFAAIEVIEAWGFRYATIGFLWVKARRSGLGFHFGMGKYTRRNTEACLLGVRGSMPPDDHTVSELIYAPVREHSRKPDDQYDKIERLYPGRRYVELFARQTRPGWERWGNEVPSTITFGTGVAG